MELTITASAPGRCGIIGNPSDIYGGCVLSCSIPARARCTLTTGVADSLPDDTTLWDAIMARFPLENVRVQWTSDIPRSSGLAGSTALLAATLACVLKARGQEPDLCSAVGLAQFAELVRDIERHEAGVVCGFQDAYMVVHGGLQSMSFAGKRPDQRGGPLASMTARSVNVPFLLITTGVERLSGSVHGPMSERWIQGEKEVIDAMEWIASAGRLGWEALSKGDLDALGRLMCENQRLIASLGGSGEAIDALIDSCTDKGAIAAKLAGAGMGGTVIALTQDPGNLAKELKQQGYERTMEPVITSGLQFEPSQE